MGKAVIAIHGGAGAISRAQMTPEREREYVAALSTIVESGQKMLAAGASALDAVTEAVRLLEECRCSTPEWARYLPAIKPTSWTPA